MSDEFIQEVNFAEARISQVCEENAQASHEVEMLRATQSLASRVSDSALHRLVSYIHCSKDLKMRGFIGEKFSDCRLWLFADADWAGEYDSRSTTGCTMILVGPNTYYPLNAFSRKQTATATSSTEAEVIAANQALRAEGLTTLSLFCQLSLFGKEAHGYAQKAGKASLDVPDGIVARIDPELDEIRYGNVDAHKCCKHQCLNCAWKTIRPRSLFCSKDTHRS